jgi:SNF2 family DNA or RNA helicase
MENMAAMDEDFIPVTDQCGALGGNWTVADAVIQVQRNRNPHTEDQALCRPHRHGRRYPVFYYRLSFAHSVEIRISRLQQIKRTKVDCFSKDWRLTDRAE